VNEENEIFRAFRAPPGLHLSCRPRGRAKRYDELQAMEKDD